MVSDQSIFWKPLLWSLVFQRTHRWPVFKSQSWNKVTDWNQKFGDAFVKNENSCISKIVDVLQMKLNLNRSVLHVKPGKASGTLRGTEGFTHALWSPRLSTAISCSNGWRFLWSAHFTVQAYLKWLSSASKFWSLLPHQGWNAGQERPLLHHRGRIKISPVILIWKEEGPLLKMMSQTKITNAISMTAISEAPAHTQLLLM